MPLRFVVSALTVVFVSLEGLPLRADSEPYLVKDIDPVSEPESSAPREFWTVGQLAFFHATAPDGGLDFWRSDGTAAGTYSLSAEWDDGTSHLVLYFAQSEDLLFFIRFRASGEAQLWVTDGTVAGTAQLTDGPLNFRLDFPQRLWVAEQKVLYFSAFDPIHGLELWRSDGTLAGTHLVADVEPSGSSTVLACPRPTFRDWAGCQPSSGRVSS